MLHAFGSRHVFFFKWELEKIGATSEEWRASAAEPMVNATYYYFSSGL